MPISAALKEILVCPQCRGSLEERDDALFCAHDGLSFPVRDGLPVMLIEEATKAETTEAKTTKVEAPESLAQDAH